jgi:hypothetical protein
MFYPGKLPYVTEEMLLAKFNGDVVKATAYAYFLLKAEEKRLERTKKLLPGTPYMNAILNEIDGEFEWDHMTPWWKKIFVKLGLKKRQPYVYPDID